MATYIYVPVATPEMRHVVKQWNDGRAAQGKSPYIVIYNDTSGLGKAIRRSVGRGVLRDLVAGDKIYVLTHGLSTADSGGALVIGNKRGGELQNKFVGGLQVVGGVHKLYTDANFARHIEEEGLSKSFVDLRLFACCAGLGATHKGNVLAPYAQRLRNSLYNRGYQQIRVTGYLGDLSPYADYFKPGTNFLDNNSMAGKGPTVRVDGEYAPMNFKDHAVTF